MTDSETETLPREVDTRKQAWFTQFRILVRPETQKHKNKNKVLKMATTDQVTFLFSLTKQFINSTLCLFI